MTGTFDGRSRIQAALAHRETERIPRDLAGTRYPSIHAQAYGRLRPVLYLEPGGGFVFAALWRAGGWMAR